MVAAVREVADGDQARRLAERLNSGRRGVPVVVVTVPAARHRPYIDAGAVARELGDLAEVYLVETGKLTWLLSEGLPPMTGVYGGAGRAYPVDLQWTSRPSLSPLRFAFDEAQGRKASQLLVADAMTMAHAAGLLALREEARSPLVVTGEVRGFPSAGRALVKVASGFATVVQELTLPDVPLPRLLSPGMPVSGTYDPERRTIDVTAALRDPQTALDEYDVGDVVLARASQVAEESAVLELHPSVRVTIGRQDVTSNDLDVLTTLMTAGEVLSVRVLVAGPDWRVSLADIDDDEEPRAAVALLPGGPPWLLPPGAEPVPVPDDLEHDDLEPSVLPPQEPAREWPTNAEPAPAPEIEAGEVQSEPEPPVEAPGAREPARPSPLLLDPRRRHRREETAEVQPAARTAPSAPSMMRSGQPAAAGKGAVESLNLSLQEARTANRRLEADLSALRSERELLVAQLRLARREMRDVRGELARSRTQLRKSGRRAERESADGDLFADPEEAFRHEVYLAWVRRIPAAEKVARPLPGYRLAPSFPISLQQVEGVTRRKVAAVVVEVLTGLVKDQPGRQLHQLRADTSGNAPAVTRPTDGAQCWRVALQVNTASARRLHFWRLPDGSVELSRVAVHDDFRP